MRESWAGSGIWNLIFEEEIETGGNSFVLQKILTRGISIMGTGNVVSFQQTR